MALVDVVVWTEQNEIELFTDGDKTLQAFLSYRSRVLSKSHPNDNAQLLTETKFDGGVNGKTSESKNRKLDFILENLFEFFPRQSVERSNLYV